MRSHQGPHCNGRVDWSINTVYARSASCGREQAMLQLFALASEAFGSTDVNTRWLSSEELECTVSATSTLRKPMNWLQLAMIFIINVTPGEGVNASHTTTTTTTLSNRGIRRSSSELPAFSSQKVAADLQNVAGT